MAQLQTQSAGAENWSDLLRRITQLTERPDFASQPYANRLDAILEAVVPSKRDPTHEKILAIINALVETNAIRRDEAAAVFNALITRVSRYNSVNVQANLDRMTADVREAVAQKTRQGANNLGSLAALNGFLSSLPSNVQRGQENYTGFISALRLLVAEIPQTEVYQAGPEYFLQSSRNGSQVVNLTQAFKNLEPLWGVNAPTAERMSISSLLTPNTRLLLLLIAPFSDSVSISRDSMIGYLLTLYREAIGQSNLDERTYNEVAAVSTALGQDNADNLQATLNFLLTNKKTQRPGEYSLTPREERILRYVQQAVALRLMQEGMSPSTALDMTSAAFEPSFYNVNMVFINKLMDYLHRAAAMAPDYFKSIIMNPRWLPPDGFYKGVFDFPEEQDWQAWDHSADSLFSASRVPSLSSVTGLKPPRDDDDVSLSEFGAAAPRADTSFALPPPLPLSRPHSRRASSASENMFSLIDREAGAAGKNKQSEIDTLARTLESNWVTYRNSSGAVPKYHYKKKSENDDDDAPPSGGIGGSGHARFAQNLFAHLKPKGV